MRDLRYAFRTLLKTPVTTAILVLSLALGIGANTAMFSLVHQMLIRSLPLPHAEELVRFTHPGPTQGSTSSDSNLSESFTYYMFRELQAKQTAFKGIAGMRLFGGSVTYQNSAQRASIHLVSGNYFDVMEVKPTIGRLLTPDDDRSIGAHFVVVLTHRYWTTRFGADPAVLNQTVNVSGYPMTVVGVAAPGYEGEIVARPADVFVPITMRKEVTPGFDGFQNRKAYWVTMMGRLKPGVSMKQAEEAINSPYHAMLEEEASLLTQPSADLLKRFKAKKIVLLDGEQGRNQMARDAKMPLFLLMGITGFVLLIACANAANLLLVRATGRRKEIAVRLSIGASRMQLIRQLLVEAWTISVAGGLLGILVSQLTLYGLQQLVPAQLSQAVKPVLDTTMLLYTMGASLVTGLAFGLYPALQATNAEVAPTLKDQGGQTTATGSAKFFQGSLVSGQVALSLVLLITAGLFATSLVQLTHVNLGINSDNLLVFEVEPEMARYNTPRAAAFLEQLDDRISALPGVKQVSGSTVPILSGNNWATSLKIEGFASTNKDETQSYYSEISPGFFSTVGAPLLNGREFTRGDNANAPKVAIINETFAKKFFPGQNPIGMHLGQGSKEEKLDTVIVGVVKDFKYSEVRNEARKVFYVPYRQSKVIGSLNFYVKTAIDPTQLFEQIRREVVKLDPNVPITSMKTMNAQINENLFLDRMISSFASIFALLATILAAIGLYGVLAYTVERRTREIGIRMALGADGAQVRRLILRQVSVLLTIGVAIGVAGALGAGRFFESSLYGVKSKDPIVLAVAVVMLIAVAMFAASVPTRRATRIDPMCALRYE